MFYDVKKLLAGILNPETGLFLVIGEGLFADYTENWNKLIISFIRATISGTDTFPYPEVGKKAFKGMKMFVEHNVIFVIMLSYVVGGHSVKYLLMSCSLIGGSSKLPQVH